ncbi:MAG TPA: Ig-like domain-containing protein, partial [Vicinamibacterales bacterium]|nr:Ig-like domain-containing protein [Vicinamibacterales bacterium]
TVVAAAANGSHTLTAVARDAAGNSTTSSSVTVNVLNDSVPPVVSLSAPADGAMLSGTVTVSANATDDTAVAGVQFTLDGVAFGAEQAAAPYSISWNTATAGNASHTLAAIARDAAGNRATSAAVHVTVNNDTTPPVIAAVVVSSLTSSGATIAWTTDEAADSEVEYGLTTAYGSFSTLDVTPVTSHTLAISTLASATTYHFRVRSRDAAGNLAVSNDFSFATVDGIAPTVALTSPAAGSTVSATVTITATASDNIGVAGVQFQLDGMPIGAEDTSAPYSIAWDTTVVTAGPHTLTAVARDTSGNRTTSAQVNVTVANSGQVTLAWDASVDPTLSGYKVYVGTASGVYATSVVDVGNLTTATLTGLQSGTVYYFALTSYNQNGDEGGFSNEVNATVP